MLLTHKKSQWKLGNGQDLEDEAGAIITTLQHTIK
jgi:hypothetical protein